MTYRYKIIAARVIDGDSVEMTFDCGFRMSYRAICRMAHINTPEMASGGEAAKQWLIGRIGNDLSRLEVETAKADKYGRWLVDILERVDGGWRSINQEMLALGLAVPYEGGKR